MWVSMLRGLLGVIAIAIALSLAQTALSAAVDKKCDVTKHHVVRHWHEIVLFGVEAGAFGFQHV